MKAGELFVNLGIKGAEKTIDGLGTVVKSMGNLKSVSLETKAAIVGAMYALERLISHSASQGNGLKNFEALTQLGAKGGQDLQRWQEALVNVGGSADDVTSSILSIQKAMAQVDLAKGLPEGLAVISRLAGGIDFSKKDDPFYIAKAIRTAFANAKSGPQMASILNYLTGTMGVAEGMLTGYHRNAFSEDALKKTHPRSQTMIDQLDKTYAAMSKLEFKIGRMFDNFVSKHGEKLIKDIDHLASSVFKLIDALEGLAEKTHIFEGLDTLTDKTAGAVSGVSNLIAKPGVGTYLTAEKAFLSATPAGMLTKKVGDVIYNFYIEHFGDAKDTKAVLGVHKHAAQQAAKQITKSSNANLRGN